MPAHETNIHQIRSAAFGYLICDRCRARSRGAERCVLGKQTQKPSYMRMGMNDGGARAFMINVLRMVSLSTITCTHKIHKFS